MSPRRPTEPQPYTPAQVAALFNVDQKTVARWADSGRLGYFRTPGGHRRFPADAVQELLDEARR